MQVLCFTNIHTSHLYLDVTYLMPSLLFVQAGDVNDVRVCVRKHFVVLREVIQNVMRPLEGLVQHLALADVNVPSLVVLQQTLSEGFQVADIIHPLGVTGLVDHALNKCDMLNIVPQIELPNPAHLRSNIHGCFRNTAQAPEIITDRTNIYESRPNF